MRLPPALGFLFLAATHTASLVAYPKGPHASDPPLLFYSSLASRAALIWFLVAIAVLTLIRLPPTQKSAGIQPRFSALAGTLLIFAIFLFPRAESSATLNIVSASLILVGNTMASVTVFQLGRSFSLMAEARQLVTTGPYSIIRHPLYLFEEISVFGGFLQFASVPTLILLCVHFAFQLQRMRNEERILREVFPEYDAYARRTARLIPGIY